VVNQQQQQFQEMEESRFATLLSAVRCYFIFQGTISTFIDERAKEMQDKIGAADASIDIKDFIEKSKTKEKKPEPLVFEVQKVAKEIYYFLHMMLRTFEADMSLPGQVSRNSA